MVGVNLTPIGDHITQKEWSPWTDIYKCHQYLALYLSGAQFKIILWQFSVLRKSYTAFG